MADEREDEPKIRIVDRRMLSDEERAGKGAPTSQEKGNAPKLEIVGGHTAHEEADIDEPEEDEGDELELSAEEEEQLRTEIEAEQFAQVEKQLGRPLTEQEKEKVRGEMERQARAMASLEIAPLLQRTIAELSQYAAVHLGLMPNPFTRLIARNDKEARVAIDAFAAIYEVMKPELDPASQREFNRVLNDLRVNYVSITGNQTGGPSRIIH